MSLIGRFLTGEYVVEKYGPGSYIKGIWQPGAIQTVKVRGSMQPLSAREMKLPMEGSRLKQAYKFYTDTQLTTIGTSNLKDADHIKINGESYRAMSVETWEGVDLPYFKTIVWREPQNP